MAIYKIVRPNDFGLTPRIYTRGIRANCFWDALRQEFGDPSISTCSFLKNDIRNSDTVRVYDWGCRIIVEKIGE